MNKTNIRYFQKWLPNQGVCLQFGKVEQREVGIELADYPQEKLEEVAQISAVIANAAIKRAMEGSK